MDSLIATARSNKVSTTLAVQDFSQLTKDYGSEQADVITGIMGNVISGQVSGDTAKTLSNNFGKIMQDQESVSINSSEVSVSKSSQLDFAIPAAKITALSSGEFVGMVADNPDQKIELKMFHAEIQNDHDAIAREEAVYVPIPKPGRVTAVDMQENYDKVKRDIESLVKIEMKKLKEKKKSFARRDKQLKKDRKAELEQKKQEKDKKKWADQDQALSY